MIKILTALFFVLAQLHAPAQLFCHSDLNFKSFFGKNLFLVEVSQNKNSNVTAKVYGERPLNFSKSYRAKGIAATDTVPHILEIYQPTFIGGANGWNNFLKTNMNNNISRKKGAPPGKYRVLIRLLVSEDGSITNIKALTNHGYGMEDEAIRILEASTGKWRPRIQGGRAVKEYIKKDLVFTVG